MKWYAVSTGNQQSGHYRDLKTAKLVSRDFQWPPMNANGRKFIARCEPCHEIKAPWHNHHSTNLPLPPQSHCWDGVAVGFHTDLPELTARGVTRISGIVDRLTNMAIFLHCRKDIDSPELEQMSFQHVISKHHVPDDIVADHGKAFNSRFRNRVCSHRWIKHRLSTAFHPQTNGKTERPKPDHGAVHTGLLQLRAAQLGRTLIFSGVCLQQFRSSLNTDDSILGQLPLPPALAVYATKSPIKYLFGNTGRCNGIGNRRDSPASPGWIVGIPGTAIKLRWRKNRDLRSQKQSLSLDATVPNE